MLVAGATGIAVLFQFAREVVSSLPSGPSEDGYWNDQ
jgi:hypothetical protein